MNSYDEEIKKKELELLEVQLKKEQLKLNRRRSVEDFFSVATFMKIAYTVFIFVLCFVFLAFIGYTSNFILVLLPAIAIAYFLCKKLKIWQPRNSQSSDQTTATTQPEK